MDTALRSKEMCPFVGSVEDAEIRFAYPSTGNYCHRVDPIEPVAFPHQEKFCLTPAFGKCPVYQENWEGPLPAEMRGALSKESDRFSRTLAIALLLILIVASALLGGWYLQSRGVLFASDDSAPTQLVITEVQSNLIGNSATPSLTETQQEPPTETTTQLPSHTPKPSVTPSPTFTQTPSNTPPPTPGPGLGTPFGAEASYVIHRVAEGESLGMIARRYSTTEDVIRAANATILERRTAWPGDQLVIPIGEQDPEGVVELQVLFLGQKTAVEELAEQCSVTPDEIQAYNNLGTDSWIPAGRWLIVPGECE